MSILHNLWTIAQGITTDAKELLIKIFPEAEQKLPELVAEYEDLVKILEGRYISHATKYPKYYALEQGSSFLLYAAIRIFQPQTIVETGVADGHSTFFILQALMKNQKGHLYSIDVDSNVGSLLDAAEKQLWTLYVLHQEDRQKQFIDIINMLPAIDLFIHDSDHFGDWQYFEYTTALKKLSTKGILASDDVDWSNAFHNVCQEIAKKPFVLVEVRKAFGLVFPNN